MSLIQYEIANIKNEKIDDLSDILFESGALSVSLENAKDSNLFETKNHSQTLWPVVKITSIFDETAFHLESLRQNILIYLNYSFVDHYQKLPNQNWVEKWQKATKPITIDNKLIVYPSHHKPKNDLLPKVLLDPGMAFGTGHHITTLLCLKWLANNNITNKSIIDYGCGSGILAIAAIKLGAKQVFALDNDMQAINAAKDNRAKNHINKNDLIITNDSQKLPQNSVDIIISNIYSNVLIELKDLFSQKLKHNGILVLSGILSAQMKDILTAYSTSYSMVAKFRQKDWALFVGIKHK